MIRVGTRVELRFDQEFTYFIAAGRVRSINKHGRARVDWDHPWPMHTGLVPVADLKRTSLKPFKPPKPNFPHITTDMVDGDDLPDLAWPEELGIDIP